VVCFKLDLSTADHKEAGQLFQFRKRHSQVWAAPAVEWKDTTSQLAV